MGRMEDTDQLLRVTTPFIRPALESLEPLGQLDRTPTTAPGNTPGTPRRRLARGTLAPPNELLVLPPPALPVRLIDPPTRWSYRQHVDLDLARYSLPAIAGEIDTAPVRRIGSKPWGLIAASVATAAVVAAAAWMVFSSGSTDPVRATVRPPVPQTVVVALPDDPADEPADEPIDEIEMPAVDATPTPTPAAIASHGTLMIGSKPPCRILIDGRDTGLTTPNRAVRVPSGRHTITLVNAELGIRHSTTLNITGGRKAKLIRDLSHEIDG